MSRHERMGAVVVIVLLLLAVAIRCGVEKCATVDSATVTAQKQRFAEQCDSLETMLNVKDSTLVYKRKAHKTKKSTKHREHKGVADRKLDPVPTF